MTRIARLREVARRLDLPDDLAELESEYMYDGSDAMRWLLVESNRDRAAEQQPYYFSTHASPTKASDYHAGQEYREDWRPEELVDLDTGQSSAVEVEVTLRFDPPIPPEVIRGQPHPERVEHRACAKCKLPIQRGQLYLVEAPYHIGCAPKG